MSSLMQDYNNLCVLLQLHGSHSEDNDHNDRADVIQVRRAQPGLIISLLQAGLSGPPASGPVGQHLPNSYRLRVWTRHQWPTGVWNPDLTGDQEWNNLVSRDSNFVSSPENPPDYRLDCLPPDQPAHHKWSPVWVNNNYEWRCRYGLLWRFIWTFKRYSALTLLFAPTDFVISRFLYWKI